MNAGQFAASMAVLAALALLANATFVSWAARHLPRDWGGALIWACSMMLVLLAVPLRAYPVMPVISRWGPYLAAPLVLTVTATAPLAPTRLLALLLVLTLPLTLGLVPPLDAGVLSDAPLAFAGPIAAGHCLAIVLIFRPTPGFGYRFRLRGGEVAAALTCFAWFGAVAIPVGLSLGFLAPGLGVRSAQTALAGVGIIFFCIALPEELAFRGLLQQSLVQLTGARPGLFGASVIFGLSHIGHRPSPNWRYVLLASLAGLAYGQVYQRTRSITASALTHALVDWTWFALFAGRGIP